MPNDLEYGLNIGRSIASKEPKIPQDELREVDPFLTTISPESHKETFSQAIDFLVPDGKPVLAAEDGTVIAIVIDNEKWGSSSEFSHFLNYITVQHTNGEFSQYAHLAKDSTTFTVGDIVCRGQQLALTGKTGWTDRDHLHFLVFRGDQGISLGDKFVKNPYGFKSLKPQFIKEDE